MGKILQISPKLFMPNNLDCYGLNTLDDLIKPFSERRQASKVAQLKFLGYGSIFFSAFNFKLD